MIFMIFFLSSIPNTTNLSFNLSLATTTIQTHSSSSNIPFSLKQLPLDGYLSFQNMHRAAQDFGNTHHFQPSAILYPKSVSDISSTIKHIYHMGYASDLTVAARGHGHSLQGQSQTQGGVVINIESLQEPIMEVHPLERRTWMFPGPEFRTNTTRMQTLKHGLSPKSWTDYLYLTVGGTLSNAGISGQAFLHGSQINNVYQ
ncbi:hypothetical protein Patl1_35057 [Pistacia atlantica]|uniref:Uncharacterized protein n=1 Tax=Pistacia atlantica TaxID=434234 RepID=A0ACC0ZU44_9ROSI|nr:hypothetical protein Patl1_35057 [Pistacia atlantica]